MPFNKSVFIFTTFCLIHLQLTLSSQSQNNPKMILIPEGTFLMGCSYGESDPDCGIESAPLRKVSVNSFEISETEVTQALWSEVMGYNNSEIKGEIYPVESVSWFEAVEFCNKLSIIRGFAPVYKIEKSQIDPDYYISSDKIPRYRVEWNFSADGYRLPTEAEWEYAARGGNAGKGYKYSGDDNPFKIAVFSDNSGRKPKPVKALAPNEAGLYDMSGNVAEWCWDWYGSYADLPVINPRGAAGGTGRVYRGGSWINSSEVLRNDARGSSILNYSSSTLGFRVARNR